MKKTLLFLVIGILKLSFVHSQNKELGKFEFGINLGTNLSKTRGEHLDESNSKIGILYGLNIEYHFSNQMSLKSNFNFERKKVGNISTLIGFGIFGTPTAVDINFDYLTLPILLNYKLGKSKSIFINGGFFTAYLIKSKSKFTTTLNTPNFEVLNDITPVFKKIDFGLSLGLGKKIKVNPNNSINIEIRNNLGLINISNSKFYRGKSIKTNSINLIIAWGFVI